MILKLALTEIWRLRGTLALQIVGFAIAIVAMSGGGMLSATTHGDAVPGSGCSGQILELVGVDSVGRPQIGWNARQAKALLGKLGGVVHAEVMPSMIRVSSDHGPREIGVAFVGPDFFDVTCVKRTDELGRAASGKFTDGAVLDEGLAKELGGDLDLQVEGRVIRPTSFTHGFMGLRFQSYPQLAWIPSANRWNQGSMFLDMDIKVVHIFIRGSSSDEVSRVVSAAESALEEQPTIFKGVASLSAGPILQLDAWTAERVHMVALLLQLFATALFCLMVVNLLTYHFGRLPRSHALASTLSAVGVPPSALWGYASIEPLIVGVLSLVLALPLAVPVTRFALAAATNSSADIDLQSRLGVGLFSIATVAVLTAIFIGIRGWFLVKVKAPARGRAQRLALGWIPRLLGLQVAVAIVTLVPAAQSAAGLYKALPPLPNFPLAGLSIVKIVLSPNMPAQENVAMRWDAVWQERGSAGRGYKMALEKGISPFLPNIGKFGTTGYGSKFVQGSFAYVTPNFFDVLGYPIRRSTWQNARGGGKDAPVPIIVSAKLNRELFGSKPSLGALVRTNRNPNRRISLSDRPSIVEGVFDDGVVGARGATGKFSLSQLSMQASIPTAYVSLTKIQGMYLDGFVRHPVGATDAQIVSAISPALSAFLPGARIRQVSSAEDLYRAPLRKERAMVVTLGILALAAFCIGLLGMLALVQMLLLCSKTEMAVRYAVGARPIEVLISVGRDLVYNLVPGVFVAVILTWGELYLLGRALESAGRAEAWGPVIGGILVLTTCVAVAAWAIVQIRAVKWMEWLRYE